VLLLRNTIARGQQWEVMVDLFLYRDPEEQDKEEQQAIESGRGPIFENPEPAEWTTAPAEQWDGQAQSSEWGTTGATQEWGTTGQDAPASTWESTEQ